MQLGDLSAGADSRHGEARDVGFRSIDWSRTHGASTAENATHGRVASPRYRAAANDALDDAQRENDRALVAWDFRGHGASDDPKDLRTVTISGVADDLEQVLCDISARGLADTEKVTLVAYSMGCQVALEWCRAHARYARGVARVRGTPRRSLDSGCFFPILADALGCAMGAFPGIFARVWGMLFTLMHYFPRIAHFCARALGIVRVTRAEFAPFYAHARRAHGGAHVAMLVSGQTHAALDVLALLDRREVPTLVVSGGKDVAVNRAALARDVAFLRVVDRLSFLKRVRLETLRRRAPPRPPPRLPVGPLVRSLTRFPRTHSSRRTTDTRSC